LMNLRLSKESESAIGKIVSETPQASAAMIEIGRYL